MHTLECEQVPVHFGHGMCVEIRGRLWVLVLDTFRYLSYRVSVVRHYISQWGFFYFYLPSCCGHAGVIDIC